MPSFVYVRLIGFTAGTLLELFWMVVILGYRRQRNFERVFFLLSVVLFFFYSGSLLALNAQIYYSEAPALLTAFAKTLLCAGLCFLPPLLIHLHLEYAETRGMLSAGTLKRTLLIAGYAPALYFVLRAYPLLANSPGFDFLVPGNALGRGYGAWLALAMVIGAGWEIRFHLSAANQMQSWFHSLLAGVFAIGAALTIQQQARQGNAEKLARFIEVRVKETFELAAVRVTLQKEQEIGDHHRAFAKQAGLGPPSIGKPRVAFSEGKMSEPFVTLGNVVGIVRVEPHGSVLSGETRASLEFLCEQLPAALDLCRLIDEKVRLERELAERDRLALLGQMAASISHNLKNPLGSIKTILQVQMESPELPESLRGETQIVLDEVGRLSSKLNQLLRFSRPAVRGGSVEGRCDAGAVMEEVAGVLRHEAERRGVALELQLSTNGAKMAAAADAVNDIVSNLVVNALEATPRGGRVQVGAATDDGFCVLSVEDNGAGISADARERLLQPFFTTKTQGTGLGLAIVARRVGEVGGKLGWVSPASEGRGTRFRI